MLFYRNHEIENKNTNSCNTSETFFWSYTGSVTSHFIPTPLPLNHRKPRRISCEEQNLAGSASMLQHKMFLQPKAQDVQQTKLPLLITTPLFMLFSMCKDTLSSSNEVPNTTSFCSFRSLEITPICVLNGWAVQGYSNFTTFVHINLLLTFPLPSLVFPDVGYIHWPDPH